MSELLTTGYSNWKTPDDLFQETIQREAILVDVRLSPRSRDPRWNGNALRTLFGARYVHIADLGNLNYKSGGEIRLQAPESGMRKVVNILHGNSAILLCVCQDATTCHRSNAARYIEQHAGICFTEIPGNKTRKPTKAAAEMVTKDMFGIDFGVVVEEAIGEVEEFTARLDAIDSARNEARNPREPQGKPGGIVERGQQNRRPRNIPFGGEMPPVGKNVTEDGVPFDFEKA